MLVWGKPRRPGWRLRFAGRRHVADRGRGRLGAAALLIALLALTLSPQAGRGEAVAVVNTDVLNLRAGPGTWADVIDKMWQGDVVDVLDGPTDDGWYEVSYYGEDGWAYGGYLAIDGSSAWNDGAATGVGGSWGSAWVNTDRLNMRAGASTGTDVLDLLYQGEEVTVTGGEVNGFVPIQAHGFDAWVWNGYLSYDGPVDSGPEHWIDVDRSSSTVTLYAGEEAISSYDASLGFDQSANGFYSTAIGTYYVYSMYAPLSWTDWGKAYIEYWVGFDPDRVNGFHSWSMDASGNVLLNGAGATGGCVATAPWAAAQIYDFAQIGMRVEVHM
jgi:uncharacterized protein YraI